MDNQFFNGDFKFKKSLGQNFIFDTNFLQAMVCDAQVGSDDEVLEIGAGAGTLTEQLSANAKNVVAVEKDEDLRLFLQEKFANKKNVKFLFGDFLKFEKNEIEKNFKKQYKVVANLPYYITTPIIFKLIEEGFNAQSLTLMVQKEVALRLVAKPKTKDYGAITAKLKLLGDVKILRNVPRTLFKPMPNVDSAIVCIKFNGKKVSEFEKTFKVIDCAFGKRRKVFLSNLCGDFGIKREVLTNIFEKLNINLLVRGEELSAEQFDLIAKEI